MFPVQLRKRILILYAQGYQDSSFPDWVQMNVVTYFSRRPFRTFYQDFTPLGRLLSFN